MLENLFKPKKISEDEELFLIKTNQYLMKNCNAIYGSEYIPRLVWRICSTIGIDIECHKGILTIIKDNKRYEIQHTFNIFKGQLVDLSLFAIKESYKKKVFDDNDKDQFREVSLFDDLPSFIISGDKNYKLPTNITYVSEKLILNKDFQPNKIMCGDELILAIYANCMASNIAYEISESQFEIDSYIKPNINFNIYENLKITEL